MIQWIHLEVIDSTNEYAKQYIQKLNPKNPFVITANYQKAGKGQQGKKWTSNKNENILLSFCFPPSLIYKGDLQNKFEFLATIALGCYDFLKSYIAQPVFLKWTNDIYVEDKKITGILIENIFQSHNWQWAIVGIGININQSHFEKEKKAVSLHQLTQQKYNLKILYPELIKFLLLRLEKKNLDFLSLYQSYLYKRNEYVDIQFKKDNTIRTLQIKGVLADGRLVLNDEDKEIFTKYGEVVFL